MVSNPRSDYRMIQFCNDLKKVLKLNNINKLTIARQLIQYYYYCHYTLILILLLL